MKQISKCYYANGFQNYNVDIKIINIDIKLHEKPYSLSKQLQETF